MTYNFVQFNTFLFVATVKELCDSNPFKILELLDFSSGISLKSDVQLAAKVHQKWNSTTIRKIRNCSFKVDNKDFFAKPGGIYASIRSMNLRRSSITGECIDYIQINYNGGRSTSSQICGQVLENDSFSELARLSFVASSHIDLTVKVHVDDSYPLATHETLELYLVFTAFHSEYT